MASPWADDLFRRIALPRLPGSSAVSEVETLVAEQLRRFGYHVARQAFDTSPARLHAMSVAATGLAGCALGFFPLLVLSAPPWSVTVVGVAAWSVVGMVAAVIVRRRGSAGRKPIIAANLVGTRGSSPRLWLVAHSDSKSQRLSLRGRVIAMAALSLGTAGLIGCLVARWLAPLPPLVVAPWVALSLIGGIAMSGSPVLGDSPGAVDNASGIIAVLVAAELLRERTDVAVLVTGAEEFGMEGARAWTRSNRPHGQFVNFDGIDKAGTTNLMIHRPRGGEGGSRVSALWELGDAVAGRFAAAGHRVRRSRLPWGVFVDGSVLAGAGMGGITVSRGDWETLGVVHTSKDSVERTSVVGAVDAGGLVAQAAAELLG